MHHPVWIVLADGSTLTGWIPASLVKTTLDGEPLQEGDTFKMVIDKKYGIWGETLLDVRDIQVEIWARSFLD